MTHPNGDVFTGTWRAGKRAQGTYTHADGSVYEGELKGSKLQLVRTELEHLNGMESGQNY